MDILLVIDMQNDILHPNGVRGKHGLPIPNLPPLIQQVATSMHAALGAQIPIVACLVTVLTDLHDKGIGIRPFAPLPFLADEGFRENTWGHAMIEGLPKPHYTVRKWAYSGFWHSELDHVLQSLQASRLFLCGYSTNGGVEATGRAAVDRGYSIVTLSDATAAHTDAIHDAALVNLKRFGTLMTTAQFVEASTTT